VLEKANPRRARKSSNRPDCFERAQDEYRRVKQLYDSKSLAPTISINSKPLYEAAGQQYKQAQAGAQKEDRAQARAVYNQAAAAEGIAASTSKTQPSVRR